MTLNTPPELLEQYDRILPGSASRIIELAELQSQHRRQLEEKQIEAQIGVLRAQFLEARLGQAAATIIALASILAGVFLATRGFQIAAAAIGSSGVIFVVVALIIRSLTDSRKQERANGDTERIS